MDPMLVQEALPSPTVVAPPAPFPRTGEALRHDIEGPEPEEHPIIQDFLYEGDVMMIYADPGLGKSVIARQIMASLSTGTPLFGSLRIPTPKRVYYLQLEGNYRRYCVRFKRLQTRVPYDVDRILWDDVRDADLTNPVNFATLAQRIITHRADVVIFDPLYKLVSGEVATEVPSKAIIRFSDLLQQELGCALIWVHHSRKDSYDNTGKKMRIDDAYYGSQWIKAHIDTSYQFTRPGKGEAHRAGLYCKKDRGDTVLKEIFLHYDPITDTVMTEHDPSRMTHEERVVHWLTVCRGQDKTTTFQEVLDKCQPVSVSHLRRIQARLEKNRAVYVEQLDGKASVWHPK